MRWIATHKALVIILLVIVLIAGLFIASWSLQGASGAVGRVARTAVVLVQKPIAALTDKITAGIGSSFSDEALSAENEKLKKEIDSLKLELTKMRMSKEQYTQLKDLSEIFNAKNSPHDFTYQSATVLSLDRTGVFNNFTIDVGSELGIERNSVVLNGDGLIGRVISSGEGWANVIAVIDESNNIGFQVSSSGKSSLGVCHGRGDGTLVGNMLDEEGFAEEGDLAVTSGIGGIYPAGIIIGKVTKAEFSVGSALMNIEIEPVIDFKRLRKVLVIT